jgi:hypothetical protein
MKWIVGFVISLQAIRLQSYESFVNFDVKFAKKVKGLELV